jgi:hypothetical protein
MVICITIPIVFSILFSHYNLLAFSTVLIFISFLLLKYLNRIKIENERIILLRPIKKEIFYYDNMEIIAIKKEFFFSSATIKLQIKQKRNRVNIHLGTLSYSQSEAVKKLLENKVKTIIL